MDAPATCRELQRRLDRIVEIILAAENTAMAAEGDVAPTIEAMTDGNIREIYRLASGRKIMNATANRKNTTATTSKETHSKARGNVAADKMRRMRR